MLRARPCHVLLSQVPRGGMKATPKKYEPTAEELAAAAAAAKERCVPAALLLLLSPANAHRTPHAVVYTVRMTRGPCLRPTLTTLPSQRRPLPRLPPRQQPLAAWMRTAFLWR